MPTPLLHHYTKVNQRGAALMVIIVIMVVGIATALVGSLSVTALKNARQEKTAAALAQAKDALIGFSVKVLVSSADTSCGSNCPRPGDLPCPDLDNDGDAEPSCGDATGSTQSNRLGRLPWKTLGLPDLRDGSGERLWYAVSNNFKNNTRTTCNNSNFAGCLNSDTPGTITVSTPAGSISNDGGGTSGAAAVIIAPGDILQRTDKTTAQDRSISGSNDPQNYLEVFNDYLDNINSNYPHTLINEDNSNFADSSSNNGFIQGEIKFRSGLASNSDRVILNDQLLVIAQDDILRIVQQRVATEVKNCLTEYAAIPQNNNYYPWAANRIVVSGTATYPDSSDLEFGRVPDELFENTCYDSGGSSCDETSQSGGMKNNWGTACTINNSNWWVNWKEMVFYGLAYSFRPHDLTHNHSCPGDTCLEVNPPSNISDKHFVVIVAGKKLGAQVRSTSVQKNDRNNYLEGNNRTGSETLPFEQSPASSGFNDVTIFQ